MGISTVSGPFRSANGFQELVDGVWVPVGSSGVSSSLIYTSAPAEPVNLDLTEPGKSITVIGTGVNVYENFVVQFTFGNLTSDVQRLLCGFLYSYDAGGIYRSSFEMNNSVYPVFNVTAPFEITFTALGLFIPAGYYNERQNIAFSGWTTTYDVPFVAP